MGAVKDEMDARYDGRDYKTATMGCNNEGSHHLTNFGSKGRQLSLVSVQVHNVPSSQVPNGIWRNNGIKTTGLRCKASHYLAVPICPDTE